MTDHPATLDSTSSDAVRPNHNRLLRFLSAEWMVERMHVADPVEPTPGLDMVIQHVVLGGPDGPVTYVDEVRDGRLASCRLGRSGQADVTLTNTWHDELAVMRGEMDPFDVVIEGRLQVTGDQARFLQVVPILQRPVTLEMARAMSARTAERPDPVRNDRHEPEIGRERAESHSAVSTVAEPFRFFETDDGFSYLHRRGDKVTWLDYGGGMWLIAGYDELIAALADDHTFSSRHDLPNSTSDRLGVMSPPTPMRAVPIEVDPPAYQAYRKLLAPRFSPTVVRDLRPTITQYTRWCLAQKCQTGRMDLFNDLIKLVPAMVTLGFIGLPLADARIVADAIHRRGDDRFALSPAWAVLFKHMLAAILARRAAPTDDLISYLIAAELDGKPLSNEQVVEICTTVVIGGMSTTAKLGLGALSYLGVHPEERAGLAADPGRLHAAIEEFLRYYSPVSILARAATEDVCVAGQQIAAGDRVGLGFAAANRDPAAFACPDAIQLDRSPNRHLAFGHGVHFCVGSNLGRLEASIMVEEVLNTIGDYRLSEEFYLVEDLTSEAAFGKLRRVSWGERLKRGLRVEFTPAEPPESELELALASLPPQSDILRGLAAALDGTRSNSVEPPASR